MTTTTNTSPLPFSPLPLAELNDRVEALSGQIAAVVCNDVRDGDFPSTYAMDVLPVYASERNRYQDAAMVRVHGVPS